MSNFTKIMILSTFSTFAFSEMTVCFKKNHEDFSTLENVKLDGGLCKGIKSQKDMKKNGWKIHNLKIKKDDYLYIFKKADLVLNKSTKESLKSEILIELKNNKQKELEVRQKEIIIKKYAEGEKIYKNKCSTCHGINAEKKLYGSIALKNLSLEQFQDAINAYKLGSYDLGNASQMRPYAVGYTSRDISNIYKYIQNFNKINNNRR